MRVPLALPGSLPRSAAVLGLLSAAALLLLPACGQSSPEAAPAELVASFPEHAARVLSGSTPFKEHEGGFALPPAEPGMADANRDGLEIHLPARGGEPVRWRTRGGLAVELREIDGGGTGTLSGTTVVYPGEGRTGFWSATANGHEEWLWLEADQVRRDEPVAVWEVSGATPVMNRGYVELLDEADVPRVRGTAREAYSTAGEPVAVRLSVQGQRVELWVDAEGEAVLVDPEWTSTGLMVDGRVSHTATLLPNGKVLVVGGWTGSGVSTTPELFDPATGVWTALAGSGLSAHMVHTATLLPNGKVLVLGGWNGFTYSGIAEVLDPATGTGTAAASMPVASYEHEAALLPNGRVLVVGGRAASGALSKANLYDPVMNTWSAATDVDPPRWLHAATPLADGRVLISGGRNQFNITLPVANAYDPEFRVWEKKGNMVLSRYDHSATLLTTGQVLVAGGTTTNGLLTNKADRYDPATGVWSATANMNTARDDHTATLLTIGGVLVAGGWSSSGSTNKSEVYNPPSGTWIVAGNMITPRDDHTATLLSNGKVLVAGGAGGAGYIKNAELYDPATGTWSATGSMLQARGRHRAERLPDGKVLVTGGLDFAPLSSAEVYDPATGTWSGTAPMGIARATHTMTLLDPDTNGKQRVLVAGGTVGVALASAEVYDIETGQWLPASSMAEPREEHRTVKLADGSVLTTGGGDGLVASAGTERFVVTAKGATCLYAGDCREGFCVDQVCCGQACDGGACDACSVIAGASINGTCQLLTGIVCSDGDLCTPLDVADCDDGDACTLKDECLSGVCTGSTPVVCAEPAPCHKKGTCDPGTGLCDDPVKDDGAACEADQDPCTPDVYQSGACVATEVKSCGDYACDSVTGECRDTCASVEECAAGKVCDPAGRCVAPPPARASIQDTSYQFSPSGGGREGACPPLALVLSALGALRRRRRSPREGHRRSAAVLSAALLLHAGPLAAQPAPTAAAKPSESPDPPEADLARAAVDRAAAKERAVRGYELIKQQSWAAALAELQESRKLYPLLHATALAALCLRKLGRFDESLDLYATLLRDFADKLTPDEKQRALQEVEETRRFVGGVEIEGSEPGAVILVNREERGAYPLLAPLRVAAGSHIIRAYKSGYEPFERRVDVAGGTTVHLTARLVKLQVTGTLQVSEAQGRALSVVVDGIQVGETGDAPLLLPLAPGKHSVLLRGDGNLGTAPAIVTIGANEVSPLRLLAEQLDAALRIQPEPFDALVAVDSVTLGRGQWEGRVRPGQHTIEIAAEGFSPETRTVTIGRGQRETVPVQLARDPKSPFWRRPPPPPHFLVEMGSGAPLYGSLGGDATAGCTGACGSAPGFGASLAVRAGYELSSGLSFGLVAGYLSTIQTLHDREVTVETVGKGSLTGATSDTLWLRGTLFGAWVGYSFGDTFGETFRLHLRLGAGGLLGAVADARTGTFTDSGGQAFRIGAFEQQREGRYAFLAPEVRGGLRLGRRLEVSVGLEVPVLIAAGEPRWQTQPFTAGRDGYAELPAASLTGSVIALFVPGVGVRYDFH